VPRVELLSLTKRFRDTTALDAVTLTVEPDEFISIVGPTGSGKTTLLRLIAGLEEPTEGDIRIDGRSVLGLAPAARGVRMVFQDYALYPHLRVYKEKGLSNLGFPLNIKGIKGDALRASLRQVTRRIGIPEKLFARRPKQLSSGEQQKVAFGRAVTVAPSVLLLDEPFSNLDPVARLRAQRSMHEEKSEHPVTTIHVTHQLSEAFALADRIVVLDEGRIVQVGVPEAIRDRPATPLVKELVESSEGV
jgi:ABC-type sugar transport system ATPase subunit